MPFTSNAANSLYHNPHRKTIKRTIQGSKGDNLSTKWRAKGQASNRHCEDRARTQHLPPNKPAIITKLLNEHLRSRCSNNCAAILFPVVYNQ
jgi:hypothetical protein